MSSDFVSKYWLVAAVAATIALGLVAPGPALLFPKLYVIDVGIVAIMFLGSLKLAPKRFKEAASRFDLVLLSLLSVFVVSPLASLGIGSLLGMSEAHDRLAILICSAQASTLAMAIVLTEIAGGEVALAMVITVVNNLATVFMTPLLFRLLGGVSVEVDYGRMAAEMSLKIVAPVLAAQVARFWIGQWASRNSRKLSISSQLIILCYVYTGVASGCARVQGRVEAIFKVLALAAMLHLSMLTINALIASVAVKQPAKRAAFVLCSSQKTLPAAILIWKSYFNTLPLGPLVAVVHHVVQLVVDSVLAPRFLNLRLIRNKAREPNKT